MPSQEQIDALIHKLDDHERRINALENPPEPYPEPAPGPEKDYPPDPEDQPRKKK